MSDRLKATTKIGFGMGDIFGGGSMIIVGTLYLVFLTDVLHINAALAGIILFLSKAWDAVSDPLMGMISDRTQTRFGRRRPYFLAGIVLIFVAFALLWWPVNFSQEAARFAFALFAYVFFSTVITMVMVPYNALAAELTLDYHERASLVSVRMVFSMVSTLVCAVIPLEIIKVVPDRAMAYRMMGIVFGLFFALPFIATFFSTHERSDFQTAQPQIDFRRLIEPFRIRAFRNVLLMYLFAFLAIDIVEAILIYYMTYYIGRGSDTNFMLGALLIAQVASIPAYNLLMKRYSKRAAYLIGGTMWTALMMVSVLIAPKTSSVLLYAFAAAVGLGTGGVIVAVYAMFPDLPDVDELVTGLRREGVYSGLMTFLRKLSSAVALFLISQVIALAGYLPPLSTTVNGVTKDVLRTQPPAFLLAVRLLFALVPAALLVASLYHGYRYPLSPKLHDRLRLYLVGRRADTANAGRDTAEEAALTNALVSKALASSAGDL